MRPRRVTPLVVAYAASDLSRNDVRRSPREDAVGARTRAALSAAPAEGRRGRLSRVATELSWRGLSRRASRPGRGNPDRWGRAVSRARRTRRDTSTGCSSASPRYAAYVRATRARPCASATLFVLPASGTINANLQAAAPRRPSTSSTTLTFGASTNPTIPPRFTDATVPATLNFSTAATASPRMVSAVPAAVSARFDSSFIQNASPALESVPIACAPTFTSADRGRPGQLVRHLAAVDAEMLAPRSHSITSCVVPGQPFASSPGAPARRLRDCRSRAPPTPPLVQPHSSGLSIVLRADSGSSSDAPRYPLPPATPAAPPKVFTSRRVVVARFLLLCAAREHVHQEPSRPRWHHAGISGRGGRR